MRTYNTKKSNSWEKSGVKPKNIIQQEFIDICNSSESMAQAASKLGLHFNTFRKYALNYGCYNTNQSGKGTTRNGKTRIENIKDYATRASVRKRIIKENLIPHKCNECEISEWKGQKLSLHLDHIDGNAWNHELSNLRFLCPNCHSLTDTYTGKNK
jgi:Zn finger protein HypA/HybF involved in hydrogenase expression